MLITIWWPNNIKNSEYWKGITVSVISKDLSPIHRMVSEKFSSKNSKLYWECMAHKHFCHTLISQFLMAYCLQRAENCTNCSTSSALSTFAISSYMWPRLQWVKSYANEEKCKQWRQQRFLRGNVPQRGLLNKVLYIIITIIFDRKGTPFIYLV